MERIPGGKARGGRCPRNVDKTELARGIKVELEHTADRRIAREIACDHLTEDARYYSKLATVHLGGGRSARSARATAAGARWLATAYGLTQAKAEELALHPGHEQIIRRLEVWREANGLPPKNSALSRGKLIEIIATEPAVPSAPGPFGRLGATTGPRRGAGTPALSALPEAEHAEWMAAQAVTAALRSRDAAAIKRAKDAHADAVEATEQAWWRLPAETRARMRETGEGPPGLDTETRMERAAAFKARRGR